MSRQRNRTPQGMKHHLARLTQQDNSFQMLLCNPPYQMNHLNNNCQPRMQFPRFGWTRQGRNFQLERSTLVVKNCRPCRNVRRGRPHQQPLMNLLDSNCPPSKNMQLYRPCWPSRSSPPAPGRQQTLMNQPGSSSQPVFDKPKAKPRHQGKSTRHYTKCPQDQQILQDKNCLALQCMAPYLQCHQCKTCQLDREHLLTSKTQLGSNCQVEQHNLAAVSCHQHRTCQQGMPPPLETKSLKGRMTLDCKYTPPCLPLHW
mmetsp:Transcript_4983/g.15653  ORF Transcript_4983/g.15653 Transcript_4983/m.15653 type:complete len:257 (-) Transcript_4983:2941-3711(-)